MTMELNKCERFKMIYLNSFPLEKDLVWIVDYQMICIRGNKYNHTSLEVKQISRKREDIIFVIFLTVQIKLYL